MSQNIFTAKNLTRDREIRLTTYCGHTDYVRQIVSAEGHQCVQITIDGEENYMACSLDRKAAIAMAHAIIRNCTEVGE